MKSRILTSFFLVACLLIGSVSFANDTGKHKLSKTEYTVTSSVSVDYSFENETHPVIGYYSFVGLETSTILVPKGTITYLSENKPIYRSPDVDRKWVWCYSTYYNI